jgi:hypothetical protein
MNSPFQTRPEDFINRGIRAGAGALPVVGGTLAEFLAFIIGDPAQERRDEFMKQTLERVINLEAHFEQLRAEELRANEHFHASFIQAARLALTTASEQKRRLLQNAVINSAIAPVEEYMRHAFMRILEEISPTHAVFLNFLADPKANEIAAKTAKAMTGSFAHIIKAALPDLYKNTYVYNLICADLQRLGLADTTSFNAMVTTSGLLTPRATKHGLAFLHFIQDPETRQS